MRRGASRDQLVLGGYDAALQKFEQRYHAASKIYQQEINPESCADIIIDNSDFENPLLVKI
jgi:uridine kinase